MEGARIEYTSASGVKGILYHWHRDEITEEWRYSMLILDRHGREILHAYNAAPKTVEQLKHVVDRVAVEALCAEMDATVLKCERFFRKVENILKEAGLDAKRKQAAMEDDGK